MNVACVVEGMTEYDCVPSLLGRLGHTTVGILESSGGNCHNADWAAFIRARIIPRVLGMAEKPAEKVLILLDREKRNDCCPTLALVASDLIRAALIEHNLQTPFVVVVCDRRFEEMILVDYDLIDSLTILRNPISGNLPASTDGANVLAILEQHLRPGKKYDKRGHGIAIVRSMRLNDHACLGRSRPLRKFLKEFPQL